MAKLHVVALLTTEESVRAVQYSDEDTADCRVVWLLWPPPPAPLPLVGLKRFLSILVGYSAEFSSEPTSGFKRTRYYCSCVRSGT